MKDVLLIKEDSPLRFGIVSVLEDHFNIHVSAYCSAEKHTIKQCLSQVDLVLIDLDAPINILEVIKVCKEKNKKIVVWTPSITHPLLLKTFQMKLNGYFYNGMESRELIAAIHYITKSQTFIHPSLSSILLEDYCKKKATNKPSKPNGLLTHREWEVMELVTQGYSNEQIGSLLFISEKTVKNHVSSILKKLEVEDRMNAVLLALKKKWIAI